MDTQALKLGLATDTPKERKEAHSEIGKRKVRVATVPACASLWQCACCASPPTPCSTHHSDTVCC